MRKGSFPATLIAMVLMVPAAWAVDAPRSRHKLAPEAIRFEAHRVGSYRSEACDVGDFNNDGKLDIIAGAHLYLAPDWKAIKVREPVTDVNDEGKGYCHDFANLALDVDGDGKLDVVSCFWHEKQTAWYRNTGTTGGLWPETVIQQNGNFETGCLWDIDGDGKAREVLPDSKATVWYDLQPGGKFGIHTICEKPMAFGGGAGDINGDGRPDVLRPNAWFEAPADPRQGEWKEHPLSLGSPEDGKVEHTPQILVYDVNGDGLNDIITSAAHKYGIFWYQQIRQGNEITWQRHLIDDSWTQAHSLTLADFDGDGDLDLATGKRFMAHNGKDPEEFAPLGVYWYELQPGRTTKWVKHVISYDAGIGSALNIPVVDLDGDGDLDVVVTGKWGGPVWFENRAQ